MRFKKFGVFIVLIMAILGVQDAIPITIEQMNTTSPQTATNKTFNAPTTLNSPTITSPTITGTTTIGSGATLTAPTITGTVTGGASYTGPTITNPSITGIVSGGATHTGPVLDDPVLTRDIEASLPAAATEGKIIWLDDGPRGLIGDFGTKLAHLFGYNWLASSYGDCNTAITAIASTQATIIVGKTCVITTTVTAPTTLTWQFEGQGDISPNTSQVLSILGPIVGPNRQLFKGPGTVTIGVGALQSVVKASWWSDFSTMIAAIGSNVVSVEVWDSEPVVTNETSPKTMTLGFKGPGELDVSSVSLSTLTSTEYGTLEFTTTTINRTSGNWITDSYNVSDAKITITGSASNNVTCGVTSATALILTVDSDCTLVVEAASTAETVNGQDPWTVTINGPGGNTWPTKKIFSGAGTVLFGPGATSITRAEWFGAVRDGVADDFQPIRSAYVASNGGVVGLLSGTYLIETMINMDGNGGTIRGVTHRDATATIIKTSGAIDAFRMSVQDNNRIQDLQIRGNNVGLNGIVAYNASRNVVMDVLIQNFTVDGMRWDENATTPKGNNNLMKIIRVVSNSNNIGFNTLVGSDTNGIEFQQIETFSNTSHGVLYKGLNARFMGGIHTFNGGYGIQLSEAGDASTTAGVFIFSPWLESNTLGGYRGGGKSARNIMFRDSSHDSFSNAAGSIDVQISAGSGAAGFMTISRGSAVPGFEFAFSSSEVIYQPSSLAGTTNVGMFLRPKGSGNLVLNDTGTGLINMGSLVSSKTISGITASTTQTQGQGALTSEVNEISVVANVNDTITLPTAAIGVGVFIINNGANTLRIFPASGDNLGAGVNIATTLAAGSNAAYSSRDITNWTERKDSRNVIDGRLSSNVVLLTGTQSISGVKTFSAQTPFTVASGTAPLVVTSTTPVANLTTVPTTYNATGTQQTSTHIVQDTATLSAGTVTVTLTGASVFTNATSYTCTANDTTAINAVRVNQTSGTSITFTGTTTDVIRFVCVGN